MSPSRHYSLVRQGKGDMSSEKKHIRYGRMEETTMMEALKKRSGIPACSQLYSRNSFSL